MVEYIYLGSPVNSEWMNFSTILSSMKMFISNKKIQIVKIILDFITILGHMLRVKWTLISRFIYVFIYVHLNEVMRDFTSKWMSPGVTLIMLIPVWNTLYSLSSKIKNDWGAIKIECRLFFFSTIFRITV